MALREISLFMILYVDIATWPVQFWYLGHLALPKISFEVPEGSGGGAGLGSGLGSGAATC